MSTEMSQIYNNRRIRNRDGAESSDEMFKNIVSSWSTDTRYQLKQFIDWKNQYGITDDMALNILEQAINEPEIKEEEPSPYNTQDAGEPNKCDFLTTECLEIQTIETETNKDSQDTQDSDEDEEDLYLMELNELNNEIMANVHQDNNEVIAAQAKQIEVNDADDGTTTVTIKKSNLNKKAAEFYPAGTSSPNKLGPIEEDKELEQETELPPSPPSSCPNTAITCNFPPRSPPSSASSTPIDLLTPLNSISNLTVNIPPVTPASPDSVVSTPATSVSAPAAPITPPAGLDNAISNIVTSHLVSIQNLPPPSSFVSSVPNTCTSSVPNACPLSVPNADTIQLPYTANLIAIPVYSLPVTMAPLSMPIMTAPAPLSQPASVPNHVQNHQQQSVLVNQFKNDTQPSSQQMDYKEGDECMTNMSWNEINDVMHKPQPIPTRQWTPPQPKGLNFQPKFNNHAKGNFYISKEMIAEMTEKAMEKFVTDNLNMTDERLAFGYYKESVAMQINDDQIRIIQCNDGKQRIIIDIDLHFKSNGETMYLVAEENHKDFVHKVRWCIVAFMSGQQIYRTYGVSQLPQSSRNMDDIQEAINNPPKLNQYQLNQMLKRTKFGSLPKKNGKRKEQKPLKKTRISEYYLRKYCAESWNDSPAVPVVVIKGKNQWIEWKKFIRIADRYGNSEWFGISLKYDQLCGQWKIECMDYDAGRIYYQHRLVGLPVGHKYSCSYNQLRGYVTTSLDIFEKKRNYY